MLQSTTMDPHAGHHMGTSTMGMPGGHEGHLDPTGHNHGNSSDPCSGGMMVRHFFYQSGQFGLTVTSQGTKIFQYCTCPAGRVTYIFHTSCKPRHLSFKSVCSKEYMGVMTSSSNSSQSTRPIGRVLWVESLVLPRFHS